MRHLPSVLLLVSSLGLSPAAAEKFRLIGVEELESLRRDTAHPAVVLDANDPEFRETNGIIPGARLLSSFDRYDVAKELPSDRSAPLVFYCSDRL